MSLSRAPGTRTQGKHLCIVVPWIEYHRARRLRVLYVACDQIEIVLHRGRGWHRVDHRRSMAARPLHLAGNPPPSRTISSSSDRTRLTEALRERISRRHVARAIGIVVREVVDAPVVFGQRQNADVERPSSCPAAQAFTDGAPCGLIRAATTWVSTSQPLKARHPGRDPPRASDRAHPDVGSP